MSSVQQGCPEANWMEMRVESTLFHLIFLQIFISSDKTHSSSDQCVNACDSTKAFCGMTAANVQH